MDWLADAGFGLDHSELRLARTNEQWVDAGARLRDIVARQLGGSAAGVEQIGSASILGLLAKPIVDLAVGLAAHDDFDVVNARLQETGWIYRGDAGDEGGHVFVLESRPRYRLAHIHAVDFGGRQWNNYVQFRDLLRRDARARDRYESVKLQLQAAVGHDRAAYTEGKSDVVRALLADAG